MKALRVSSDGINLEEIDRPHLDGEVLVRIVKSGICNTDLEIARGYAGFKGTIGHEFVGVVESSEDHDLVGKRVVGEINVGCGECALCLGDDSRHCASRTVLGIHGRDGAHAEFLTLPARNLLPVPDDVSDVEAVFVEPLAAAFGICEQVNFDSDDRVAIIGDGKLGILCARSLSQLANGITIVGKHPDKLGLAAKYGNVTGVLLNDVDNLHSYFDVVIEASGSEPGFATALDLLKPRGTLILKSTFHGDSRWNASRVVVDEITIRGSRCGRFEPALKLLSDGIVEVEDLVTVEFGLGDGIEAMQRASQSGVLKVLLNN